MSVSGRISDAIAWVVSDIALSPTPAVRGRKKLALADGESPPVVVIAVADRVRAERAFSQGYYFVYYPAAVALGFAAAGKLGDNATLREWRESVWPRVADYRQLVLGGLAEANDVHLTGGPIFDASALSAQVDWAVLEFEVETLEAHP